MYNRFQEITRFGPDVCSFCGRPPYDGNPLAPYCGCSARSHQACLIRHIQFNRVSTCEMCLMPFRNVRIIYPNRGMTHWLREDYSTRKILIRTLTILILIIYLGYLSLLQLAVRYQVMHPLERYLLQFLMYMLLYSLVAIFLFFVMFMIGSYYNFRQTFGHVNVIPLNPDGSVGRLLNTSPNILPLNQQIPMMINQQSISQTSGAMSDQVRAQMIQHRN